MQRFRQGWLCAVIAIAGVAAPSTAQFTDDFESCPIGNLTNNGAPGCNRCKNWAALPNATSLVNTTLAHSGTKSVSIDAVLGGQTSDLVHTFSGYNSGRISARAFEYFRDPRPHRR
jgi:hypothetical protein